MNISSKTILRILAAFLVTVCLAQSGNDEQEVRNALEKVRQAILQHDITALEQLYGDDLTVHYADGSTGDKTSRMKGGTTSKGFNLSDVKIKMYGTTAVVTGISSSRTDTHLPSVRFTQVWVKRDGHWQEVALSMVTIRAENPH